MLQSFLFENFKSFNQAELRVEQLTTLIGSNSGGKTNAIEGIKILSEIATGRDFSIILDGSKNIDSDIRGGSRGCAKFSSNYFILGCKIDDQDKQLIYKIELRIDNRIYVEEESLMRESELIFRTKKASKGSGEIKVEYNNGKRGTNPDISCVRYAGILPQIAAKLPDDTDALKENIRCIQLVIHTLRNILFLNPISSLMRDYSRMNDMELRPNAENISAVLYNLCKESENEKRILSIIKALPENEVTDIEFIQTKIGDVMFALKEKYGKEAIEAKRISDGTIRCMAIIAALISEKSGSMIVIEEVDNGIHPSRARDLICEISKLSKERKLDVLITTHNPALLNALGKDELVGVSVCYRDKEDGSSKFIALLEIQSYPKLMAQGALGDLSTRGDLLSAIKEKTLENNPNHDWLGL